MQEYAGIFWINNAPESFLKLQVKDTSFICILVSKMVPVSKYCKISQIRK